jgi:gamma-glutamyltranspeptidase
MVADKILEGRGVVTAIAALALTLGMSGPAPVVAGNLPAETTSRPVLGSSAQEAGVRGWIRSPAYSTDGRLAFEVNGDIWVSGMRGGRADLRADRLVQVTDGPAWDRDPAWAPDGDSIVFASDRSGAVNLWSVAVDDDGRAGGMAQLTIGAGPDTQPTVAPDGRIVFVRGRAAGADLWVREAGGVRDTGGARGAGGAPEAGGVRGVDGETTPLKETDGAESAPLFSPDGDSLLYIAGRTLHRITFDDDGGIDEDETIVSGMSVAAAAWAPDGERVVFGVTGGAGGVYVAPADGRFTNLVAEVEAAPAWSPDGAQIALAELAPGGPGYNGDPDRLGDRAAADIFATPGEQARFWLIDAPAPFASEPEPLAVAPPADREAHNGEAFDRVWQRLADLYFDQGERAAAWAALRDAHRPRALAAGNDAELQDAIHAMLRERPTARDEASGRAAVSSAHPIATAAGVEVLEAGGNVVDAAVAVSFALGVVEPDASGLGGYGEMVVYVNGMAEPVVIEFLTRAPQAATLENGALANPTAPMLANVPGVPRGMQLAFDEYGSGEVEWARLLEPAIRAADEGFVLDDAFPTTLARERASYEEWESSKALFFKDGEPLRPGDRLRNPDLAWTLRQIAEGGANAFYEGEVARRMVEDLRGKGNAMTRLDMARYYAVERPAVVGEYRGHTIYGAAPPVSGGVSLVAKLNLLDNFAGMGLYSEEAASAHALIEAWKLQPSSRGRLSDPGLWPVDIDPVIDPLAAQRRWAGCFDPDRAIEPDDLESGRGGLPACAQEQETVASLWGEDLFSCRDTDEGCRSSGTTAFAVADGEGNFVAVTQTLGTWGGNFYVTPGLGFPYNDKLRSYGSNPEGYGARLPYARNSTTIAPALVFRGTGADKRPYLAVGAAGNAWINAAVYTVITGIIDGGLGPQRALELPRFLVSGGGGGGRGGVSRTVITAEDLLAPAVVRRLRELGHAFQMISMRGEMRMGYGAAVLIEDGRAIAGADPRRSGAAGAARR